MKFSIVISTKNDDKATTLRACLREMADLPVEIIVVDWGSEEKMELPDFVRHIYVPPELAAKYNKDSKFALNVSSNVGIRRAVGEYIFYMGNDTFGTNELLGYVLMRCTDNTFYIVCRRHIDSIETMETYSQSKVSKRWGASGAWVAHRNVWHTLRGFDQRWIYYGFMDREIVWRSQIYGFNVKILPLQLSVYHVRHPYCEMRRNRQENEIIYSREELTPTRWDVNDENWGLWDERIES